MPLFASPKSVLSMLMVCSCCLAALTGCGKPGGGGGSAAVSSASMAGATSAETAPNSAAADATVALPRKIIYTGKVERVADDLSAASGKITALVESFHGYIAESSAGGGDASGALTTREETWKIRLPADRFNEFLNALGGVGELQSRQITSQDVSEEFYDVDARLKNKKVEEARLLEHLKATGKLSDILLVEKEISRVREEIERVEGRLRFLANQTDLCTITLTLRQTQGYRHEAAPSLWTEAQRTFGASLSGLAAFGRALLIAIVALLPWALVGGAIAAPLIRARRQRRRRSASVALASTFPLSADPPALKQRLDEQENLRP